MIENYRFSIPSAHSQTANQQLLHAVKIPDAQLCHR